MLNTKRIIRTFETRQNLGIFMRKNVCYLFDYDCMPADFTSKLLISHSPKHIAFHSSSF